MLLKVIGDPSVMAQVRGDPSRGAPWQVDDDRPLGGAQQLARLSHLFNLPVSSRAGELPPGYHLHRCNQRGNAPAERLHMDLSPRQNRLLANSFVWLTVDESRRPAAGPQAQFVGRQPAFADDAEWEAAGMLQPTAAPRPAQTRGGAEGEVRGLQLQLIDRQNTIEDLGRQLQHSQQRCQILQRQLLQQSELLRRRERADGDDESVVHAAVTAAVSGGLTSSGLTVAELEEELERTRELADRLDSDNETLRRDLAAAESRARAVELRLEAADAWRQQHDPAAVAAQQQRDGVPVGSELRRSIEDMRGTLRDILPQRERSRNELTEERRQLSQRHGTQRAEQEQLLSDTQAAVTQSGQQLMPTPYYLDPYRAPATCYQIGSKEEGSVCQLRVQTLQGEGTVVRRAYSAVTKQGKRVLVLASLDGVVTDEVVAEELVQAGIGYGSQDTLLLATRRHRWVLTMQPPELRRWLDYLCTANPALRPPAERRQQQPSRQPNPTLTVTPAHSALGVAR